LPEDELSSDPTYPPQSLRSWIRDKDRNKVTPERRIVYFASPPDVGPGLEFLQKWKQPRSKGAVQEKLVKSPKTSDVLGYLEAFYHGLPVKMLPSPSVCFTADVDDEIIEPPPKTKGKKRNGKVMEAKSQMLWLNTHTTSGCVGIRTRATPKGDFTHQLNLNDLLDAAIEMVPSDAYALLMLVDHDIYEDEDDEFACGRAYGGSRIAVVSSARYNPILDAAQGVERDHGWPASHCEKYMQSCCTEGNGDGLEESQKDSFSRVGKSLATASKYSKDKVNSPMDAAVAAHISRPSLHENPSVATLSGLWLGRVCRTASHELGHCFGIDHCVYYACAMQGTASVIEDARQPLNLCPIDLAKVLRATGANMNDRYRELLAFCEKHNEAHLFAAYGAWICGRMEIENDF